MANFKVNFVNIGGIANVRSKYNSTGSIKRSTGISINDKIKLERTKSKLESAYESLKALRSEEREKYGGSIINLSTIWERYLEDIGERKLKPNNSSVKDNVLFELERYEETHKSKSANFSRGSRQVHTHLSYFSRSQGYHILTFKDLTRPFLETYKGYLMEVETEFVYEQKRKNLKGKIEPVQKILKKKKYSSATVKKHFTFISDIVKYVSGDIPDANQAIFNFDTIPETNKSKEFLEYEEVIKFLEYHPKGRLETLTLDLWLFMAFSGLRVSKVQALRNGDIKSGFIFWDNTKNQGKLTQTTIHKYNSPYIIKYKKPRSSILFPYISQQQMNKSIKSICKNVGIDKSISAHSARYTYNELLKRLPIDDFDRREELGHAHGNVNDKVYTQDKPLERKAKIIKVFENIETLMPVKKESLETSLYDDI